MEGEAVRGVGVGAFVGGLGEVVRASSTRHGKRIGTGNSNLGRWVVEMLRS